MPLSTRIFATGLIAQVVLVGWLVNIIIILWHALEDWTAFSMSVICCVVHCLVPEQLES